AGPVPVLGDDAGGDQTAVGVVDAVALSGGEQEPPLVFLPRPAPVLGQVGARGEIAEGQVADRQGGERRCRHEGHPGRPGPSPSTGYGGPHGLSDRGVRTLSRRVARGDVSRETDLVTLVPHDTAASVRP